MKKLTLFVKKIKKNKLVVGALLFVLTVAFISHAWNLLGYPYIENDEATYISRATTFITTGELDVYTYRYDHAPLGWMFMGVWLALTGGDFITGSLIGSGRVLMLLLFMASATMVFFLTKRITNGNIPAAIIATLVFSISPLAIYFHRRILLDNVMTFWVLLSMVFATWPKPTLKFFILSATSMGIAILTKLNAIFFLPALLFMVYKKADPLHRIHASLYWLATAGIIVVSFFVYAFLKSELLPATLNENGEPTSVSVMDTFALQLGRGDFAWPWMMESSFMQNVMGWGLQDWTILIAGIVSTLLITFFGLYRFKKQPLILALALMVWCMFLFLARGKIVLNLYIVPLLPFLSMTIGVLVYMIMDSKIQRRLKVGIASLLLLGIAGSYLTFTQHKAYATDETSNQLAAVEWVRGNLPSNAIIATDNYMYPYLAQESNFKNVSYFFSTEYDPEIRKVYDNDWRNIEYLVLTHEIVEQIETGTVPRIKALLDHSTLIADFTDGTSSYLDLKNYVSTNGDWAQVYKVKKRDDIILQDSWNYFKGAHIVEYGRVIDSSRGDETTSDAQAAAMIRAVQERDKNSFDGIWQWSKDHLQYRTDDKLVSSLWSRDVDGTLRTTNTNASCHANQQFIYGLYKASDAWKESKYSDEANLLVQDWWRQCVINKNGVLHIAAFADGDPQLRPVVVSTFNPTAYRYLGTKQPNFPWGELISDGYTTLTMKLRERGSIPNWWLLNAEGSLVPTAGAVDPSADSFGRHTLDLITHLIEDYHRTKNQAAFDIVSSLQPNIVSYRNQDPGPQTALAESLAAQVLQDELTQGIYERNISSIYKASDGYWGDKAEYLYQITLWKWHYIQLIDENDNKVRTR